MYHGHAECSADGTNRQSPAYVQRRRAGDSDGYDNNDVLVLVVAMVMVVAISPPDT